MRQILHTLTSQDIDNMILIKWGKPVLSNNSPAYVSNAVIGKIYGIHGSSVQRLYIQRFKELNAYNVMTRKKKKSQQSLPIRQRYGYRFLTQEHIDFLTSPDTLVAWSGKSYKERCILFHRQFGNHRINPTLLAKVYKIHKIKRKRIKLTKTVKSDKHEEYDLWRQCIQNRITTLRNEGYCIIYTDESYFTTKTIQMTSLSPIKIHHSVREDYAHQPIYTLILAISMDRGLEHYEVSKKRFNENMFSSFLDNLYVANKHRKIALFMDNASSHKTNMIKMKMSELEIEPIYSVPYQPDLNPTEACFSKIKNHYKRKKLNMLMNGEDVNVEQLLHDSVSIVNKQNINNWIRLSQSFLNK